jgi:hypothetical protein
MADGANAWAIVVPAASGLAGAFLGAWLSRWNEQRKQRLDFAAQQLREFYSPLLSIRTHVRALSELRLRIEKSHAALGTTWPGEYGEGAAAMLLSKQVAHSKEAKQLVEFNNEQFRTVLLPQYEKMLAIFQDKYWLADETTRPHYQALLRYIELWKRFLAKTIPGEILTTFDVRESELHPLYENLERQFEIRQRMLKTANPKP